MQCDTIRGGIIACAAAIALLAAGCHANQPDLPPQSTEAVKALQQLKSLPSFEDTKTQLQKAVDEITTAARRVMPSLDWLPVNGETPASCETPYDESDGKRFSLPDFAAPNAKVSEADWQTILATAKQSAAEAGAMDTRVIQDEPSNHDVGFYGPAGMFIIVAYQGNLIVSGDTGCRLPADKH